MAVHAKKMHRGGGTVKKCFVGTIEEALCEWFDALKETYSPMPMWGVIAEIEADDEEATQESLQKKARTAELMNHKWDVTKLAALGFENGTCVKAKSPPGSKSAHVKENVWRIVSIEGNSVGLEISEYFGSSKPENMKVMMDEFVACWDKHVVRENLVYMYGIVIRVRGVISRLL